jgi:hypothetical protein
MPPRCPGRLGDSCEQADKGPRAGRRQRDSRRPRNDEGPSMHELEGPRRSCAPCRVMIAHHRPAAPDCSTSRGPRSLVACCRGTVVPKCPGPDRSGPGPPWTVRRGLTRPIARPHVLRRTAPRGFRIPIARVPVLRGTGCSPWFPVPIARLRLLCGAGVPPTLPRSLEARQRGTAPPRQTPIARDLPSQSGPCSSTDDCSPVHVSEPITGTREPVSDRGLPRPATFRKSPSGPAPVPGDIAISSGRSDCPTRAFGPRIRRVLASTGRSTGQPGVVPRSPPVVHRFIHRIVHTCPQPCPPCGRPGDRFCRRQPSSVGVSRRCRGRQSSMYGQCRQPRPQHVPRSARNCAVRTNSPLTGSR